MLRSSARGFISSSATRFKVRAHGQNTSAGTSTATRAAVACRGPSSREGECGNAPCAGFTDFYCYFFPPNVCFGIPKTDLEDRVAFFGCCCIEHIINTLLHKWNGQGDALIQKNTKLYQFFGDKPFNKDIPLLCISFVPLMFIFCLDITLYKLCVLHFWNSHYGPIMHFKSFLKVHTHISKWWIHVIGKIRDAP